MTSHLIEQFAVILAVGIVGALLVPVIMMALTSVGLFPSFTIRLFGREYRF